MDTKHIDRKAKGIREQALAKFREEVGATKRPPAGWLTCKEISRAMDISARHAINIVNEWLPSGYVRLKKFKVQAGQMHRLTPHYSFHPRLAQLYGLPSVPGSWSKTR